MTDSVFCLNIYNRTAFVTNLFASKKMLKNASSMNVVIGVYHDNTK